jgi:hypothetical protein
MIFNDASTGMRGIVQAFHENVKLNFDIILCRIPQVLHRRTPTECDRFVAKVPRCPHVDLRLTSARFGEVDVRKKFIF